MDIIHIRQQSQIQQNINGHRLYLDRGVFTLYPKPDGLIHGAQPVMVILDYTEPHEELCGFYFPNSPQRGDMP